MKFNQREKNPASLPLTAVTVASGRYKLTAIPPRSYHLEVSPVGISAFPRDSVRFATKTHALKNAVPGSLRHGEDGPQNAPSVQC